MNYFIENFFDVGTRVVVMHDDLKGILELKHNGAGKPAFTKLSEEQACQNLFQTAFELMKKTWVDPRRIEFCKKCQLGEEQS